MIFLDLDGVLADFPTAAMKLLGRLDVLEPGKWPPEVYYAKDLIGMSEQVFWKHIDDAGPEFWANLPLYSWSHKLVAHCSSIAPVVFLTDPTFSVHCETGKRLWMEKHFGPTPYVLTNQKHLLSKRGRLLIDDHSGNCNKFRTYTGHAIEFPGPWRPRETLVNNCPFQTCITDIEKLLRF